MKRTLNFLGWAMLVSLVLSVALVITAVSTVGSIDTTTIQVNGEPIDLDHLDGSQSLIAVGSVALALLIAALVVPLAVLIPLAIVAVALIGALLLLAGVLAMACSPLILAVLVVWLMVRLIRRGGADAANQNRRATGATIAG